VESVIGRLKRPDAVVVNPPRTGLAESVGTQLGASGAARVVYVSCDPATLARDLTRLEQAYQVASLRAFDLFPQSAHVETVARLERR
jgi:23S rRNA (uracil1939-C5)-methyltransferase